MKLPASLSYRPGVNMDCEYLDLELGICRYLEKGENMPKFYDECTCVECIITLARMFSRD